MDKLVIPFGNHKIVAEINDVSPEIPNELWIHIRDHEDKIVQDICIVSPHFDFNRRKNEFEVDNDFVDCFVWGNSDYEDYTDKHVIAVHEDN